MKSIASDKESAANNSGGGGSVMGPSNSTSHATSNAASTYSNLNTNENENTSNTNSNGISMTHSGKSMLIPRRRIFLTNPMNITPNNTNNTNNVKQVNDLSECANLQQAVLLSSGVSSDVTPRNSCSSKYIVQGESALQHQLESNTESSTSQLHKRHSRCISGMTTSTSGAYTSRSKVQDANDVNNSLDNTGFSNNNNNNSSNNNRYNEMLNMSNNSTGNNEMVNSGEMERLKRQRID